MIASPPECVAVAAHPQIKEAASEAEKIALALQQHGLKAAWGLLDNEDLRQRVHEGEFDLLVALGGDGTMLRAGHLCAPVNVPILGINLGRFGFLAEYRLEHWQDCLPALLQGAFWLEARMMLRTEQWRGSQLLGSWDVLNEVVVSRGGLVRPIRLNAIVDGRFLAAYVADALIASTATGSTAYALAAGGPILPPELRNILLVPVAPHLSIDRAIVLAEGSTVSITVHTDHEAVISIDGQPPVPVTDADRVDAMAGEHTVKFVRFQDPGYFYRNLTPHMNQNPSTGNRR
jgi:NAD+ kinase